MKYLTVRQVAERLGVSRSVIYACIAAGRLPHIRVGLGRGTIRVKEGDVDEFEKAMKRDDEKLWSEHFA